MSVLYHNCPGQRTLLITHSNQALNDLFAKVGRRRRRCRCVVALALMEAHALLLPSK